MICYYYAKHSKNKNHCSTKNMKMQNNDFEKVQIKNCTCYFFDGIIKLEDFYLDNILIDEKSYINILIYDISYKNLIGPKFLRIRFDKTEAFITTSDGTRYLTLFGSEEYVIYNRITHVISLKSNITYIFYSYDFIDSYDSSSIGKILTLHIIIPIKLVINKDKHHCYYIIFLEKCFC